MEGGVGAIVVKEALFAEGEQWFLPRSGEKMKYGAGNHKFLTRNNGSATRIPNMKRVFFKNSASSAPSFGNMLTDC